MPAESGTPMWNKGFPKAPLASGLAEKREYAVPTRLDEVASAPVSRMDLKNGEFNRVLGGGIVPGSLVLIGGEPGIGKSTLALQVALKTDKNTLYISGEESPQQIKMRADRLGGEAVTARYWPKPVCRPLLPRSSRQNPSF